MMKPQVLIPAFVVALCAYSAAHAAMSTVPYLGPNPGAKSAAEPNRLTGSDPRRPNNSGLKITPLVPLNPYLSLAPMNTTPRRAQERSGPGFLNADPFDPNSVVNSFERNIYANPYPYDPIYNPYGQGSSPYAPGGGPAVPMGNGVPYRR